MSKAPKQRRSAAGPSYSPWRPPPDGESDRSRLPGPPPLFIQRQPVACGNLSPCQRRTTALLAKEEDKLLWRQGGPGPVAAGPEVAGALTASGPGMPLPPDLREEFEGRFGADFRRVRLHTDPHAALAAQALQARAFTRGEDIYFAPGQGPGASPEAKKLLAHELTHVVQQQRLAAPTTQELELAGTGDPLEREAVAVSEAVAVGRPLPELKWLGASSWARQTAPQTPPPPVLLKGHKVLLDLVQPQFALTIPKEKGPVGERYQSWATQGKLRAISEAEARQQRPGTTTLQNIWKRKIAPDKAAKFNFAQAPGKETCQVDHIIELQLGGTNAPDNLQLLEPEHNRTAGARFRGIISDLKSRAKSLYNLTQDLEDIDLLIRQVSPEPPITKDRCREAESQAGVAPEITAGFTLRVGLDTYVIDLAQADDLAGGAKQTQMRRQVGRRGHQLITGLTLDRLTVYVQSDDFETATKDGSLNAEVNPALLLPVTAKKRDLILLVEQASHQVKLPQKPHPLEINFPFLSTATLNLELVDGQPRGRAELRPSLPLFRHTLLILELQDGSLSGALTVPAAALKQALPIPGLTITESSIEFKVAKGGFSAGGNLGFKIGTVADGSLKFGLDKSGLSGRGKLNFQIPGLEEVSGELWYRQQQLGGLIVVSAAKLKKVPGITGGRLELRLTEDNFSGQGTMQLAVPGLKQGTLDFAADKQGNYGLRGRVGLEIPGLKSAELELGLEGGELIGAAKVGLDIPGLSGAGAAFEIKYRQGAITGRGTLTYQKGKLSGQVHAALNEKRRLTGGGELSYQLFPGLVAAVGLELREDGTTKISGALKVPETIDLFPVKSLDKKIFSLDLQIPIFAIPVGTKSVGLVAEIGADLRARAGIGPGQIRKAQIQASFDPAKEEAGFEFKGGGELYVPAFAELALGIHGGIGLSLALAAATGGLELVGALGLQGALIAMVQISYQDRNFVVDASAELNAQPVLKFNVNAYVKVSVIIIGEVYRKDWLLAAKEWGSGLKIGLRFPVHYVFGQPFDLSLSQVEFIVPQIDVKQAVKDLLPR